MATRHNKGGHPDELENARELLFALVDSVPFGVFIKDLGHRFIAANRTISEVMGAQDPGDLVGKTDHDFYPKGDADEYRADERRAIESKQALVRKLEQKDRNGEKRWVVVTKRPVIDASGQVVGLVGISEDLTEEKRREEQLVIERNLLRTVLDLVTDTVYAKDTEYRKTLSNPHDWGVLGVGSEAEVLGKTDWEFFPEEVARSFAADDTRVVKEGRSIIDREEHYVDEEGRVHWLLTSKVPLRNSAGEIVGLVGNGKDITERKATAEKMREQAELLDIASDAIIVRDMDNRIRYWNKSAEQCFGWTADEAMGKDADQLVYRPRPHESVEAFRSVCENGFWEGDLHFISKSGQEGVGESRWTLVRDESGDPRSVMCVSTDVTERRSIQARLMRAQRLESLGQLASGIAHYFNNINGAITGYLSLVAGVEGLPDTIRRYVEEARQAVKKSTEITARLEILTGAAHSPTVPIRVEQLLDGLLSELSEQMAGDSVKVETAWAKTQPVRASSTSLEFVFRSILLNAVHALAKRDARVIRVRTYAKDAFSCAEIADTGWGLNEEQIVKVFTPFFTTKGEWAEPGSPLSQVKGTGLSLAVSRSLINECGGHIELDSREGVGTTFRVCLPVETEKAVDNP